MKKKKEEQNIFTEIKEVDLSVLEDTFNIWINQLEDELNSKCKKTEEQREQYEFFIEKANKFLNGLDDVKSALVDIITAKREPEDGSPSWFPSKVIIGLFKDCKKYLGKK